MKLNCIGYTDPIIINIDGVLREDDRVFLNNLAFKLSTVAVEKILFFRSACSIAKN